MIHRNCSACVPDSSAEKSSHVFSENALVLLSGADVLAALQETNDATLVDIRSREEHLGLKSGYSYMELAGRPAGARWGEDVPSYRTATNRKRASEEILAVLERQGIDYRNRTLYLFCGTGWRASEVFLYLREAGLQRLHVFNGWMEWSLRGFPSEDLRVIPQ